MIWFLKVAPSLALAPKSNDVYELISGCVNFITLPSFHQGYRVANVVRLHTHFTLKARYIGVYW